MSLRKIIFIAVSVLLTLGILFAFWKLSNSSQTPTTKVWWNLNIWILDDTTEGFEKLEEWFKKSFPEYSSVTLDFKKFNDYGSYQKILLSTLADGNGPDIFMVEHGADSILRDKLEPIPSSIIDIPSFEKRFEDIFLDLVENTGSTEVLTQYLRGVPLGYETLGIFYNKSLLINVPKTWNDVSQLYLGTLAPGVFPTNIGMSPRYTPETSSILAYFLAAGGHDSYASVKEWISALDMYTSFANTPIVSGTTWGEEDIETTEILWDREDILSRERLTTYDLFIRWEIAFVIGYPRNIRELEDAKKRAGTKSVDALILSEKLPQESLDAKATNIARYKYLWLSKTSNNSDLWAAFLNYLTTEDAGRIYLTSFPEYIPAQRIYYESARNTSISSIFPRIRLGDFIPDGMTLFSFDYGNKWEFEKILTDTIDRNDKIDKNNILDEISARIYCDVIGTDPGSGWDACSWTTP
jgi:maltose-binding protein MalE